MALVVNKNELVFNKISFNSDYRFSLEDAQFGVDLEKNGFNIIQLNTIVWHNETSQNLSTYLLKINRIYREGYLLFKKNCPQQCKRTIWFEIEKYFKHDNLILKVIIKLIFSKSVIKITINYLDYFNNQKFMYFKFLYMYVIVGVYVNSMYE